MLSVPQQGRSWAWVRLAAGFVVWSWLWWLALPAYGQLLVSLVPFEGVSAEGRELLWDDGKMSLPLLTYPSMLYLALCTGTLPLARQARLIPLGLLFLLLVQAGDASLMLSKVLVRSRGGLEVLDVLLTGYHNLSVLAFRPVAGPVMFLAIAHLYGSRQ